MGDLVPVAFDIETSGLEPSAVITVAGLAFDMGAWLVLNTGGREADASELEATLEHRTGVTVQVTTVTDEGTLLAALNQVTSDRVSADRHYLTAYNGERWRGGFDLPFLRSACVRRDTAWPFPEMAYADVMTMVDRFNTGDTSDLVGVYEMLIGEDHGDPFTDSGSAVGAYEEGNWKQLLAHNYADIVRTRELAVLAGRYVPKSDYKMKNLAPPDV